MASAMKRFTNVLGIPAAQGATVVCIALEDEKAKVINGSVQRVPLFAGKDYLSNMPGFFDMIGRVVTRVDKDNKVVYPPGIMFESSDNSFMAKWTGPGSKRNFQLDIRQILEANK